MLHLPFQLVFTDTVLFIVTASAAASAAAAAAANVVAATGAAAGTDAAVACFYFSTLGILSFHCLDNSV